MKKYLLGFLAIALAVGFSAFTNSTSLKKRDGVYYYQFIGVETSMSDVQNRTKWQEISIEDFPEICTGVKAACFIEVDEDGVDLTGSFPHPLKSTITLVAEQYPSSSYYNVNLSSSPDVLSESNRYSN